MTQHDSSPAMAEYLGDDRPEPRKRLRRGAALAVAGAVAASVAAGGWAAAGLIGGGGDQPAEVVPASALAYLSVDLDPTARQKVEALRMAGEFPVLRERLGLAPKGDLRRWLFERSGLDRCEGVDYEDDVAPWVGKRAALALLPGGHPEPVMAVAVRDTDRAEEALTRIVDCSRDTSADQATGGEVGFAVAEGHVLIAGSTERAEAALEEARDGALADDASFRRWTEEAGAAGVVTAYLSAEAPRALAGASRFGTPGNPLPGFTGLGAVLRFADGTLELEVAAAGLPRILREDADGAGSLDLPEDTGAALSAAPEPGWAREVLSTISRATGMPPQLIADAVRSRTGVDPDDAERLLGESVSLAVDASADSGARAGLRVVGDPDRIVPVADRLAAALGRRDLVTASSGEVVALGQQRAYLRDLVAGGTLGDQPRFRSAVPRADRAALVAYGDFDAEWAMLLAGLDGSHGRVGGPQDLRANLAPLDTLGAAVWTENGVHRGLLRISTD